MIGLGSSA